MSEFFNVHVLGLPSFFTVGTLICSCLNVTPEICTQLPRSRAWDIAGSGRFVVSPGREHQAANRWFWHETPRHIHMDGSADCSGGFEFSSAMGTQR